MHHLLDFGHEKTPNKRLTGVSIFKYSDVIFMVFSYGIISSMVHSCFGFSIPRNCL
jgi:hypothetical protein